MLVDSISSYIIIFSVKVTRVYVILSFKLLIRRMYITPRKGKVIELGKLIAMIHWD